MDESTRVSKTPIKSQIVFFLFFFGFILLKSIEGFGIIFVFLIFENVWPLLAFSGTRLI